MTITPETLEPRADTIPPRTDTPAPVGTLREASAAPDTDARPDPSPADQLFAEGIALLDAGDHLAAAEKVWHAAVTAMVTYSDARGWKPQDWHPQRKLMDIAKLRCQELGIPYIGTPENPDPVMRAVVAADTLEAHIAHDGHFLDMPEVRRKIDRTQPLLDYFRLD